MVFHPQGGWTLEEASRGTSLTELQKCLDSAFRYMGSLCAGPAVGLSDPSGFLRISYVSMTFAYRLFFVDFFIFCVCFCGVFGVFSCLKIIFPGKLPSRATSVFHEDNLGQKVH